MNGRETAFPDYFQVLWKRRKSILIPTLVCIVAAAAISFLLPKKWEIDTLILPGQVVVQTEAGMMQEFLVVEPKQIVGRINGGAYTEEIAAELDIPRSRFPRFQSEAIRETNLVRILIKESDTALSLKVLQAFFEHIKAEFDKKIDFEIKSLRSEIDKKTNERSELGKDGEVKTLEQAAQRIEKERLAKAIEIDRQYVQTLDESIKGYDREYDTVMKKYADLDLRMQSALTAKTESGETTGVLLYSQQLQLVFQYLSDLRLRAAETRRLQNIILSDLRTKEKDYKQIDNKIEQIGKEREKLGMKQSSLTSEISLLDEKKSRIDYTQLAKKPTVSAKPVFPKKKQIVLIAAVLSLLTFVLIAFGLEYVRSQKDGASR